MKKQSDIPTLLCTASIACTMLVFLFCSDPENPFQNQNNVTISFLSPDSTGSLVYTNDPVYIRVIVTSSFDIDSVKITTGSIDSLITIITDTITLLHIFSDSGLVELHATAYCKKGLDRECQRTLHIAENPLVPPDTLHTLGLSPSSIRLWWHPIVVAAAYNVYRGPADTGSYTLVQTVSDTACIDTALIPVTSYFYKVTSVDSLNRESEGSLPFSATTLKIPASLWDTLVWDEDTWE